MSGFPQSPKDAYKDACFMAKRLGLSLIVFVQKAKEIPSTVYRWRTNKSSYNVRVFASLTKYFESEIRRLEKKKARKA